METGLRSVIDDFTSVNDAYHGDAIDLATLWLLHRETYASNSQIRRQYRDLVRSRLGLEYLDVDFTNLDTVKLQVSTTGLSQRTTDPIPRPREAVDLYPDSEIGLVTYGLGELFWEAIGGMEIAKWDYIVFPQSISGGWTGGAQPDGAAFRLGAVQNVLAEIGLIPGGATLPEIEVRSRLNRTDPTDVEVDEALGVIEAKKEGSGADGVRELASHRGGTAREPAYLDFPAVDRGWLVCPFEADRIRQVDRIGGVTWTEDEARYDEPPTVEMNEDQRSWWIEWATEVVLTTVLRYQNLPRSLAATVEDCQNNPSSLYDIL